MPGKFLRSPIRVPIVAAIFVCILGSSHRSLADEPGPTKQPVKQFVEVKFWVIEVSKSKLRNLGFDWEAVTFQPGTAITDEAKFLGFIEALDQNNLASILSKPMIATRSGQKATIEIAPFRKFEVTPTIIDAEHIDFDYHVEVSTQADKGGRRLISACSTELKSGVAQLLSETTTQGRTAKGAPAQTTLLVLAQATIVKP